MTHSIKTQGHGESNRTMKNKNDKKITFGIIGYGRFGKLWAKYMSKYGMVFVFDKREKIIEKIPNITVTDLKQAVSTDIIFLTVPISELEDCCKTIRPLLSSRTLVVDMCSVKIYPVKIMKKYLPKNQLTLATHPLFGPDSEKINQGINGLKIVVCPSKIKSVFEKRLIDIFKKLKLKIITASPKDHDRQMANSQALVHFIGRGLAKLKLNPQEIYTPDYNSLMRLNQMVNNDTWQLFFDMQRKNPFASIIRQKFIRNLEILSEAVMPKKNTLQGLRENIEKIDNTIIRLLSMRLKIAKNIGILKQKRGFRVVDHNREKELMKLHHKYSGQNKIDQKFIDKIFNLVIKHSRAVQKKNI